MIAAQEAKKVYLGWASKLMGVPAEELKAKDRRVYVKSDPSKSMTVREVLEGAQSQPWGGTAMGTASRRTVACPPHFAVPFAEVEVDTITGRVRPIRLVQGVDVGRVIMPAVVRGESSSP